MALNSPAVLLACVAGAIAVTAVLLRRCAPGDALPYLSAYFVFFGFGPVVNVLLGNDVYFGIRLDQVGLASIGLLLALLGMLVVKLLVRERPFAVTDAGSTAEPERQYPLVPVILLGLAGYALWVLQKHGTALLAGDKLDRIALAGPRHYQFLLAEMIACSLYFIAVRTPLGCAAYWINMVCYVAYCLATAERDFLFVIFVVLLHSKVMRKRGRAVVVLVVGALSVVVAGYLFEARGGDAFGLSEILNQGTVLFVDTYVMTWTPSDFPFEHGQTYLSALLSILPQNIGASPSTLSDWLLLTYAPGTSSGYGFSLTGEAYLNFGLPGIPVVFGVLTLIQRVLVRRLDRHPFYPFASILFTVCWMYGFRGESIVMVRTLTYGAICYGVVHLASRSAPSAPVADVEEVTTAPAALR